MNIKIPKKFMGSPIKGAMQRVLERKDDGAGNGGNPNPPSPLGTDIQGNPDFWRINGVEYRNEIYVVDLMKTLLDGGNAKTQDEWIEYSRQAKANNGFYNTGMPLFHSLFRTCYLGRDATNKQEIEEIREFVGKQFAQRFPLTLTRILYQPKAKGSVEDILIQNKGMDDEYSERVGFVGPDEWVKDSKTPQAYKALFGSDDLAEINAVYNWLTGKNAYLWRVNSRSSKVDERVARFWAYSGRAGFSWYRDPAGASASLGVRYARVARGATKN